MWFLSPSITLVFEGLLMRFFCLRRFSRTAHEVLSPVIMMDFQGLLMRCFVSMSRDEFPSAPRKFLFFKRSQICCLISSCSVFLGHCSHSCQDLV